MSSSLQVSIVIPYKIESDGVSIWMQRRVSSDELNGFLEFPGGKIEKDETALKAAIREVKEETGVELESARLKLNMSYKNNLKSKAVVLNIFTYRADGEFENGWYRMNDQDSFFDEIPAANKIFLKDVIKSIS